MMKSSCYLGLRVNSTPEIEQAVYQAIKNEVRSIMQDEPMDEIIS